MLYSSWYIAHSREHPSKLRTSLYMEEYIQSGWVKLWRKRSSSSFGLVCIYGIMSNVSYTCTCIYMYIYGKSLWYWSCEKMIHAYASIWWCSMHDIIIEIREKACVHIHQLEISTQEWKWKQLSAVIQRIYERWRVGALAPPQKSTEWKEVK